MTQIKVDFNRRAQDGKVIASSRRADGALVVGEKVQAVQPEEGLAFEATVANIDEKGRVFLDMVWEGADTAPVVTQPQKGWYQLTVKAAFGFTAAPGLFDRHGSGALSNNHLATA
jgi:hypothetical protein